MRHAGAFVCTLALAGVAAAWPQAAGAAEFVPGELIVGFEQGVSKGERADIAESLDGEVADRISKASNTVVIDLPGATGVAAGDRAFSAADGVAFAEPNYIYTLDADTNDTFYDQLWGLKNIGQPIGQPAIPPGITPFGFPGPVTGTADADIDATTAWNTQTGSTAIKVGVIDSGVTVDHPDIAPNIASTGTDEIDFIEDDTTPDDENSHGSHVAGTIGAVGDNAMGITGVNQDVGLMPLKAGWASGGLPLSAINSAIAYARNPDGNSLTNDGARVVNMSFSGTNSQSLDTEMSLSPNVLFVAAAGNGGGDGIGDDNDGIGQYPCQVNLPNVICVAASGQTDNLASFSNFGVKGVDIAAPGTRILSVAPVFKAPEFTDNFNVDNFATNWVVGGVNGTWSRAASGQMIDSPIGVNYLPNADHFARLATPLDLTGETDCRVRMDVSHDIGAGDQLLVQAADMSLPAPVWQTLGTRLDSSSDGQMIRELQGFLASGTTPLTDFSNLASVGLRFRLVSDGGSTPFDLGDGAAVDNVVVECRDRDAEAYGYKQGTSMAAPHVSGAAALLLADDPSLTPTQLRNTILSTADPIPSMTCRTFTGGRLNIARALASAPVNTPPASTCPTTGIEPPPPEEQTDPPVKPPKCKKAKKGASRKAKIRAKRKCEKLKKKAQAEAKA